MSLRVSSPDPTSRSLLSPCLPQIAAASRAPWSSRLASPAASWLDDFSTWASPEIPQVGEQGAGVGVHSSACMWAHNSAWLRRGGWSCGDAQQVVLCRRSRCSVGSC